MMKMEWWGKVCVMREGVFLSYMMIYFSLGYFYILLILLIIWCVCFCYVDGSVVSWLFWFGLLIRSDELKGLIVGLFDFFVLLSCCFLDVVVV